MRREDLETICTKSRAKHKAHRWHYNGLVFVCRNGCGGWRKRDDPGGVVRDRNDPAVKKEPPYHG